MTVAETMAKLFIAAIKLAFNTFNSLWNNILKPAIQTVKDGINAISTKAAEMRTSLQNTIKKAFEYVKTQYDTYIKPVFTALDKGFGKIGEWATNAKTAVGKGFEGLVDKIKGPIRTAIIWINDHLIKKLNTVTDKFGLKIDTITVPAKAEGGPVTGRGGPTQDNLPHLLSNGEYVIKTKSARRIGMRNLDVMNKTGTIPLGLTVSPPRPSTGRHCVVAGLGMRGTRSPVRFRSGLPKESARFSASCGTARSVSTSLASRAATNGPRRFSAGFSTSSRATSRRGATSVRRKQKRKRRSTRRRRRRKRSGRLQDHRHQEGVRGREGRLTRGWSALHRQQWWHLCRSPAQRRTVRLTSWCRVDAAVSVGSKGYKAGSALAENLRAN